jgi:hypothetical protein
VLEYDRLLKYYISKRRPHSLFHQDGMLYQLIPTMPDARLLPLPERVSVVLDEISGIADTVRAT